jgi:hypothetical protein
VRRYSQFMGGGDKVIVRDAVAWDAEGVSRAHIESWRETYSDVLDDRLFLRRPSRDGCGSGPVTF